MIVAQRDRGWIYTYSGRSGCHRTTTCQGKDWRKIQAHQWLGKKILLPVNLIW